MKSPPTKPPNNQVDLSHETDFNEIPDNSRFRSVWFRRIISAALLAYMAVVLLGPLSNPVGSEFLTGPLARTVAPIHRALFLGHGYRFFAPDPGPGHLVVYRIVDADGNQTEGHFPDRENTWPRLMYHRWFMLSETIYREHASTPDKESFDETNAELDAQVKALRKSGHLGLSGRIARQRHAREEQYRSTRERIDILVKALARHLLETHNGQQIELFVQERNIPFAIQVLTGDELGDEKFLSPLIKIGEFQRDENGEVISLEDVSENASSVETEVAP